MGVILCLAHYCDTHGPTPVMVTEGLPVGCITCLEHDEETPSTQRPSSVQRSSKSAEGRESGCTSVSAGGEKGNAEGEQRQTSPTSSSAVETPPASPRIATLQGPSFPGKRRESSFRKTYDENDKKRAIPCDNCALTLPKKTKEGTQSKVDNNGPVLRTKKPYERVSRPRDPTDEPSPPKSASSSDSETPVDSKPPLHRGSRSRTFTQRTGTSSSSSSFNSTYSHDHFLDYTSTHEPLTPTSFSIIRQSCLRTLSCETLPPSSSQTTASPTSPTSPFINNPFSTLPSSTSSNSTSSGGPILFGDALAGYTTAFIFRLPDPSARGRRRVYALMALSTHRERLAMASFSFLSTAFKDLAAWIQGLAEAELEKAESASSNGAGSTSSSGPGYGGSAGSGAGRSNTSSFLSGRNRGLDGKFAGLSLKARGLAEIVGLPDFFLELHARFVRLLIELGMLIGSS